MNRQIKKSHAGSRTSKPAFQEPLLDNPLEISARFHKLLAAKSYRNVANEVITDPRVFPMLSDLLSHEDIHVRRYASWAVKIVSDNKIDISYAIPNLIRIFEHGDSSAKTFAALALMHAGKKGADISAAAPALAKAAIDSNSDLALNASKALKLALSRGAVVSIEDLVNSLRSENRTAKKQSREILASMIADESSREMALNYILKRVFSDSQNEDASAPESERSKTLRCENRTAKKRSRDILASSGTPAHILNEISSDWRNQEASALESERSKNKAIVKVPPHTLLQVISEAVEKNPDVARGLPIPLLSKALSLDDNSNTVASLIFSKAAKIGIDISQALPELAVNLTKSHAPHKLRAHSISAIGNAINNESSRKKALTILELALVGSTLDTSILVLKAMEDIVQSENAQYTIPLMINLRYDVSETLHRVSIEVLAALARRGVDVSRAIPFMIDTMFNPLDLNEGAKSSQAIKEAASHGGLGVRATIIMEMMALISRPDFHAEAEKNSTLYVSAMRSFGVLVSDIERMGVDADG